MMGPTVTSSDATSLYALLAAVADPQATKAALDKIVTASTAAQEIVDSNAKILADTIKEREAADKALAAAEEKNDAAQQALRQIDAANVRLNNQLAARETTVVNREAVSDAREKALAIAEADLEARRLQQDDVAKIDKAASDKRDAQLAEREVAVAAREKYLEAGIADYQERLAKLKSLVD